MSVKSLHHAAGSGSATEELEMTPVPLKPVDSRSTHRSTPPLSRDLSQTSVQTVQTKAQKRWTNVQFASLCFSLFLAGWNDGTTGPLLPRIQEVYHVGSAVVSMIFVFATLGCISGAFLNFVVTDRLGFGKVIVFGAFFQIIGYTLEAAGEVLPFPVFVLGYAISGIGMALQDAQANGYVAGLRDNKEAKMGMLHAAYGAGAFASPLVATQFAQMQYWSFHYLASLGLALLNVVVFIAVFRLKSEDECYAAIGQAPQEQGTSADSKFRQVLALRSVHLLAFYWGTQCRVTRFMSTAEIRWRGGGGSGGYVRRGFGLGLVLLLHLGQCRGGGGACGGDGGGLGGQRVHTSVVQCLYFKFCTV
ncbi:MFS general substrate transporter [Athelia psychrophila]|uniref:MFS general substrate transporter n=1 Tax=Athelia psychrophila TaxID=1759441 RepID=A0A165X5C2_9AGAM|nr:MFS general substrate transporter [Fibularhizoctonia sp. CBS 109695]